jgi:hypothetical protein
LFDTIKNNTQSFFKTTKHSKGTYIYNSELTFEQKKYDQELLIYSKNETFNFHFPYLACTQWCPAQQLKSPNEAFTMDFSLQNDGTPTCFEV